MHLPVKSITTLNNKNRKHYYLKFTFGDCSNNFSARYWLYEGTIHKIYKVQTECLCNITKPEMVDCAIENLNSRVTYVRTVPIVPLRLI